MIRIDEIYSNIFWPWLQKNKPSTRLFFCDPPGRTDPDALFNYGNDAYTEIDYVWMHDQEPCWVDEYSALFDTVINRNKDLHVEPGGHIVVSEHGEYVDRLCQKYGWQKHYYFYHGWACQDWFRGYDKAFLIPRARERTPSRTFMSPNRIVGGKRDHRVLFLYHIFKQQLEHNHISAPRICQYENVDISLIANKYCNIYPDISQVFSQASLPRLFVGEESQQMTSCWLTNFNEAQDSLVYVPTETVYFGRRTHITEKTFKAIALEMPFVLVAAAGSLEYLRSYGFKTFSSVFDESYDEEIDDILRVEKVAKLLKQLDSLSPADRQAVHDACLPMVEHNYNHFYHGGFTDVLWTELTNMLSGLSTVIRK
tara:strand:+ start:511 stop:1614 length:1104 start_codon:yes stop_codon:yes gene_type:complete